MKANEDKSKPPYSLEKNQMNGDWLLIVNRPCVLKVVKHQFGLGHHQLSEQGISFREVFEDEMRRAMIL